MVSNTILFRKVGSEWMRRNPVVKILQLKEMFDKIEPLLDSPIIVQEMEKEKKGVKNRFERIS